MGFNHHDASFRDPTGYIFTFDDEVYRHITSAGLDAYKKLMESGLYGALVSDGRLVTHEEINEGPALTESGTAIKPQQIPHISYPYEWSFSALKDAALLTLEVCKTAVEHGMILKDASAYNILFYRGKPIFIDTGSFARYVEGGPWEGYRQFCQHFLAPLLLASKVDIRFIGLLESWIDGIPLDLASKLLPRRTWISWGALANIHLHARAQQRYSDSEGIQGRTRKPKISRNGLLGMLEGLASQIRKLTWQPGGTEWGDYYSFTNYSDDATKEKMALVEQLTSKTRAKTVWDLGGNVGLHSRAAMTTGADVVCWDIDPAAVERNYLHVKDQGEEHILPLVLDLTNPSKGIGWAHTERSSLEARGPVDLVMALALVHHLAISNNVPLDRIAEFFSRLGHYLLIEFVPKEDSQVRKLLSTREDVFDNYHIEGMTHAFETHFTEMHRVQIAGTVRTLILYKNSVLAS